ncbi:MAG: glycerol kinase GlpK [Ilumatobacteraceae bacterium]
MSHDARRCVIAIDAGTTGVRSRAIFADGGVATASYQEFTQTYPQPGWVEHDANEIWSVALATLNDVVDRVGRESVAAIGIANQRETVVAWNRQTGKTYGSAIVWQDRRTADRCEQLRNEGHLASVRQTTGLVLDPYFSASKFEWLLANRDIPTDDQLALGTIDSWLIWNLTEGAAHVTDPTNASRTMLFDIRSLLWSPEMCDLFGVPISALPTVLPSSGRFGETSEKAGCAGGIPIAGVAGDQQAALIGQACFTPGMAKNTYGTGSFVLLNVGPMCPPPAEGMLTTIAWQLADGTVAYALEGAIFVTGAAIQWLRDGLGLIESAAEIGTLAATTPDSGGVYVVPAFTGLGSPWWDPYARGAILGITRGTSKAHLARAVVEAMAYQTRDAVEAMAAASGTPLAALRVDGGASVMDVLLQMQADQLGVAVQRPIDQETTALGAAYLAGLAEGVWPSVDAINERWQIDATFEPEPDRTQADLGHQSWLRAVERSRGWIEPA